MFFLAWVIRAPGATPKEIKCAGLSKELGWRVDPKTTSDERIADYEIRLNIARRIKREYNITVDPIRYTQPALWDIEERAKLARDINHSFGTKFTWRTASAKDLKVTQKLMEAQSREVLPETEKPAEVTPNAPTAAESAPSDASAPPTLAAPTALAAPTTATPSMTKASAATTTASAAAMAVALPPLVDDRLAMLEAASENDNEKFIIARRIRARTGISLDYRRYSLRALKEMESRGWPQSPKV
ncbi:MAG TPA: hypothetical protein VGH65_04890 [Verrucomicrobiaceae bacterium]